VKAMDNRHEDRTIKDIQLLKAKLTPRFLQSQRKELQAKVAQLSEDIHSEDVHG